MKHFIHITKQYERNHLSVKNYRLQNEDFETIQIPFKVYNMFDNWVHKNVMSHIVFLNS
jgi:hypothetical protein